MILCIPIPMPIFPVAMRALYVATQASSCHTGSSKSYRLIGFLTSKPLSVCHATQAVMPHTGSVVPHRLLIYI